MKHPVRLASLVCLVTLGVARPGLALDPHRSPSQYVQDSFDTRRGMPQNYVSSITQTLDGYLWLGSDEGVARFDGRTFTTFDRVTAGLPSNLVRAVLADGAGGLWLGLQHHGLLHLSGGTFKALGPDPDGVGSRVRKLRHDRAGDLWVATLDGGLVRVHDERVVARWSAAEGLPTDEVRSSFEDSGGRVWIGTGRGAAILESGVLRPGPPALKDLRVAAFAEAKDGVLSIGTSAGLVRLQGDTLTTLRVADGLPSDDVKDLLIDRDGCLWVATFDGIARVVEGHIASLRRGLLAAPVLSLLEDAEGGLWIGSELGLTRLRDGDFTVVSVDEGLPGASVFSVLEDRGGTIWFGTADGVAKVPRHGPPVTMLRGKGTVLAFLEDRQGTLWIGVYMGGVWRSRDGRLEPFAGSPQNRGRPCPRRGPGRGHPGRGPGGCPARRRRRPHTARRAPSPRGVQHPRGAARRYTVDGLPGPGPVAPARWGGGARGRGAARRIDGGVALRRCRRHPLGGHVRRGTLAAARRQLGGVWT